MPKGMVHFNLTDCVVNESKLDLNKKDIFDNDVPLVRDFLLKNPQINNVCLRYNHLTEEGIKLLAHVSSIKHLDISDNHLGPKGAKIIATTMLQLESLHIGNNNIGMEGTIAITQLQEYKLSKLSILSTDTKTPKILLNHPVSSFLKLSLFVNKNQTHSTPNQTEQETLSPALQKVR